MTSLSEISPSTHSSQSLQIVVAQLNCQVGDIPGNTALVLDAARQAIDSHQATLVVFPELTLVGYSPEDLLLRPALQGRIERALSSIVSATLPCWLVVGHPWEQQGRLYNTLSVIHGDQVVARYFKQCLPNTQVFDEKRYFTAGERPCVVAIEGARVGFSICEDLWAPEPARQAADAGAELLVNINASPFHTDKMEQRVALLEQRQQDTGLPIIYANLVGGQDELVFDGNSLVADARGVVQTGPAFAEALVPLKMEKYQGRWQLANAPNLLSSDAPSDTVIEQRCYQAMVLGLRDYITKNGFSSVILGLSGGIDSALSLAVAVDALGAEQVSCVMMPFTYTSQLSLELAAEQAERLQVS